MENVIDVAIAAEPADGLYLKNQTSARNIARGQKHAEIFQKLLRSFLKDADIISMIAGKKE